MSRYLHIRKEIRTVTVEQAAEALHLHKDTVRRLLRDGKMPGARVGGQWRIHAARLEEYLKTGKISGLRDQVSPDSETVSAKDLREIRAGLAEIRRGDIITREEYRRKRGL